MKRFIFLCTLFLSFAVSLGQTAIRGQSETLKVMVGYSTQKVMTKADLWEEIWSKDLRLFGVNGIKQPIKIYKISYKTTNPAGELITVSGKVYVPLNSRKPMPVMLYNHVTCFVDDAEEDFENGLYGEKKIWSIFATDGYVVLIPDGIGYGASGEEVVPFLHKATGEKVGADMLKAFKELQESEKIATNGQVFLMGISLGGYNAMATNLFLEKNEVTGFKVAGLSTIATPYLLRGEQIKRLSRPYKRPQYMVMMTRSYGLIYNMFGEKDSIWRIFAPEYRDSIRSFFDGKHNFRQIEPYLNRKEPLKMLMPNVVTQLVQDTTSLFWDILRTNELLTADKISNPIQLCGCESDDAIPFSGQQSARKHFLLQGNANVQSEIISKKYLHLQCATFGTPYSKCYFDILRKGKTPLTSTHYKLRIGLYKMIEKVSKEKDWDSE